MSKSKQAEPQQSLLTKKTAFRVVVDSAETYPFEFLDIPVDGDKKQRTWEVQKVWKSLGRHPNSFGDYSMEGFEKIVAVERKSIADLQGTILGWPTEHDTLGRRGRFECELSNLSKCEAAAVVVEGHEEDVWRTAYDTPNRTAQLNAKTIRRSVLAYRQDFPRVQWIFREDRRLAEVETFRFLQRYWRKWRERQRHQEIAVTRMLRTI